MSHRTLDDPLSLFGDSPVSRNEPSTLVTASSDTFRGVDTSKVRFKEKKTGASNILSEENNATTSIMTSGAGGLGIGVSLWENDVSATKSDKSTLDSVFDTSFQKNDGIFARTTKTTSALSDNYSDLFSSDPSSAGPRAQSRPNATSKGIMRVGNQFGDDTKVDDLAVGQLLQREMDDDLDYATFGKVDLSPSKPKVTTTTASSKKSISEDMDISNMDILSQLETATVAKKQSDNYLAGAASSTLTPSYRAAEIDMGSLDLNAYISQQESSSSGGLFD